MKTIMIYAYSQFNLGDDLFIQILCQRYPHIQFKLYAPRKYNRVFKHLHNLTIIPSDFFLYRGINYIIRKLGINMYFIRRYVAKQSQAMVYIGGSLFIQSNDWEAQLKILQEMQIDGKPFFLIGANFGPYQTDEFYYAHKQLFQTYTDICFRDTYSYQLFNDLPNVRLAEDVVFLLNNQQSIKRMDHKPLIVISVINPSNREELAHKDEVYYEKIKELIIHFIQHDYQIVLMAFCTYEKDQEAIEAIHQLLPHHVTQHVSTHIYEGDIDQALQTITKADLVIATRFHAMILGWVYEKPVFPIVYSDKMLHVMKDVNFTGSYVDFDSLTLLTPETVISSMQTNMIDLSHRVENAQQQFTKLDEYLSK